MGRQVQKKHLLTEDEIRGVEPGSPSQGLDFKSRAEFILIASCFLPVISFVGVPIALHYVKKAEACGVAAGWAKPVGWVYMTVIALCVLAFILVFVFGKS
jgi:hypothetical protein